jgi:mRNA interferase MazF
MGKQGSVAGRITRGDVRLCRFPLPDKARRVVVLTRDRAVEYLAAVTVAPITSAIRGVSSEVILSEEDGMKGPCAVNLHAVTTIRQSELGRRVAQLSSARMDEICEALRFALGCEGGWNIPMRQPDAKRFGPPAG